MLIDCDTCTARPRACGDCIVTHLLSVGPVRGTSAPPGPERDDIGALAEDPWDPVPPAELDDREIAAVGVLAAGGLVPPLRLVTDHPGVGGTRRAPATARRRPSGSGSQVG